MKQDENKIQTIKGYIERAVPDIARKCGCSQDEVVKVVGDAVEEYKLKNSRFQYV